MPCSRLIISPILPTKIFISKNSSPPPPRTILMVAPLDLADRQFQPLVSHLRTNILLCSNGYSPMLTLPELYLAQRCYYKLSYI